MENDAPQDGEPADHKEQAALDSILEALLVDDADVLWDPVTGRPHVLRKTGSVPSPSRRRKPGLDSPPGSA